ncbi:MAG: hypothetical protein QOG17_735 [Gammaproteobacteria bacterium]|nr:hypothetical protein [Gammaproteobacteria bacterium]
MSLAPQSEALHECDPAPNRTPLCEACNLPMAFVAEYRPMMCGEVPVRREYQCRLCHATVMVDRIPDR